MKTKIKKWIIIPLLACILVIAYVIPAKAQYVPDEYTVGLWHFDKEFGTALSFDGIGDYVEVPYSASLDIIDAITIEAWVYAKGTGNMLKIACKRETRVPFYFIGVDGGWLYAGIGDGTSSVVTDKVTELPLNEWHHVAMAYSDDDDKIWLYLDGELKETVTCAIQLVPFLSDLIIGAQFYNGQYMQFFKGTIDEVRISNVAYDTFDLTKPLTVDANTVALWHFDEDGGQSVSDATGHGNNGQLGSTIETDVNDPTWVDSTVNSTLAIDSSSNENHGTIYGATWVDLNIGNALSFDGVDDYINIPDDLSLDITDEITLEAWFKITDFTSNPHMYILSKDTTDQRSYGIGVNCWWAGGAAPNKPFFVVFTTSGVKVVFGTTRPQLNTWYHLMGVYSAFTGELKLYLNGKPESSTPSTPSSINVGDADLQIGARQYPPGPYNWRSFFYGVIDEVRISNVVRDPGMPVYIDIKPGSDLNEINLGSKGVIPVAILSSACFDATSVDPDTVRLGGAGVAVRGKGSKLMAHEKDVNGDGLVDLVIQVETENLDPNLFQDGRVVLIGFTYDGEAIKGSDEIIIVPGE